MASFSNRFFSSILSRTKHLIPQNPNPKHNRLSRSLYQNSNPRTLTPLEKQFDSWIDRLRPGFTPSDVDAALRAQSDPDLALDLFRWTALRPGFRHSSSTYHTILQISISSRRFSLSETLIQEILSGACDPDLPLLNSAIRFCCSRRHLFSTAFDIYKKMLHPSSSAACRPSSETYSMLLAALLRRFGKPPVSFVYLHALRSLVRQMKASGVIPDTLSLNLIIKAYSKCLEMDEAIRVFREMGLYGCEPNEYSYGYIAKGLCEKGRIGQGLGFYKEMKEKGLVPTSSVYMAVICSLAMDRRFGEGIEVMNDMLGSGMVPDILTYRTLLEGLCREGRTEEAFELLEELGRRKGAVDRKTYSDLLDGLHWLSQPRD